MFSDYIYEEIKEENEGERSDKEDGKNDKKGLLKNMPNTWSNENPIKIYIFKINGNFWIAIAANWQFKISIIAIMAKNLYFYSILISSDFF